MHYSMRLFPNLKNNLIRRKWLIIGLNVGYLTSDKEDNELYTPYYAVDHIIKYLPKDKIIWLHLIANGVVFIRD